jgi:hypothetical protein
MISAIVEQAGSRLAVTDERTRAARSTPRSPRARRDGLGQLVTWQLGPIRHTMTDEEQGNLGPAPPRWWRGRAGV